MAKSTYTFKELVSAFTCGGVDKSYLVALASVSDITGLSLIKNNKMVQMVVPKFGTNDEAQLYALHITPMSIDMLVGGELSDASQAFLAGALVCAMDDGLQKLGLTGQAGALEPLSDAEEKMIKEMNLPEEAVEAYKAFKNKNFGTFVEMEDKLETSYSDTLSKPWEKKKKKKTEDIVEKILEEEVVMKVSLIDATKLLQLVRGTDESSVYICVALGPRYNVAIRIKVGGQLSIRCEGEKILTAHDSLIIAGLAKNPGGHYSMHFQCLDVQTARKTFGAVLMAFREDFVEVVPNLKYVVGEGI